MPTLSTFVESAFGRVRLELDFSDVPAVTHVDGTARVHTVEREVCPRYHRLIEAFGIATGTPVLLNTSFNLQGEPIVNTPAEALATFWRSGMDTLVLGDHMIEK